VDSESKGAIDLEEEVSYNSFKNDGVPRSGPTKDINLDRTQRHHYAVSDPRNAELAGRRVCRRYAMNLAKKLLSSSPRLGVLPQLAAVDLSCVTLPVPFS
jgi:hypothetical protein